MSQAAEFFRDVGASEGFSVAAAEVFDRLADLKDRGDSGDIAEVWTRLAPDVAP